MAENKKTFWKFLKENKIEIPIIQRDYAQGRLGKEYLRQGILSSFKNSLDNKKELKLDFVYGSVENGKLQPLDGQQRLTTLWLLHWYIALRAGHLDEAGGTLNHFSYETRISSREFCEHLCDADNFTTSKDPDEDKKSSIVDFITQQTWFYSVWRQDPTIQSMLRMLGGTRISDRNGNDIIDGIEELFSDTDDKKFEDYWQVLTNHSPIVFYYLPLEEFGLSDDLYIKMNARGKQLTMFENFKADLIGYIEEKSESEQDDNKWKRLLDETNGIPIKMDTTWTDIFWKNRSQSKSIDEIYFAFINRYILNHFVLSQKSADQTEGHPTFSHLYGYKGNDTSVQYTTFEVYEKIHLEDALYRLKATMENFYEFIETHEGKSLKEIEKEFLPAWHEKNNFPFIPEYTDNGSITDLTQAQRVIFHAICKYFEQGKYDETSFRHWIRVSWNLVENGNVSDIDSMIGLLRLIDELSSHCRDIYEFLASHDPIHSRAASEQQEEEREKAGKILEDIKWEETILSAEKYSFFRGSIGFLFRNQNGEWDWTDFNKKWENVQKYFKRESDNQNSVMNEKFDNAQLLKSLISHMEGDDFWEILWQHYIVFNNKAETWKYYLSNNGLCNPVHQILVLDDITIVEKQSSDDIEDEVIYSLSNTGLLDFIMKEIPDSWIRTYHYHTAIYPSGRGWGVFFDAKERDKFLLHTPGINLSDEFKIKNSEKLYGSDINFEYGQMNFQWYRSDYIYLMKDDNPWKCLIKDDSGQEETEKYYCFEAKSLTADQIIQRLENLKSEYEKISSIKHS